MPLYSLCILLALSDFHNIFLQCFSETTLTSFKILYANKFAWGTVALYAALLIILKVCYGMCVNILPVYL
jgi:hypothetical protein